MEKKNNQTKENGKIFLSLKQIFSNIKNNLEKIQRNSSVIRLLVKITAIILLLIAVINFFGLFVIFPKWDLTKPDTIEFISKDENTLKVLVIPFKNYNNSNLNIAESITDRLKEKIEKENLNLEVIYDTLAKPTTLFNEAKKIALGKKSKTDIVLFGEFESNDYKMNLLNLTKEKIETPFYTEYIKKKISGKYIINSSNKKIKSLNQIKDQEYIIYKILFHTAIKNRELFDAQNIADNMIGIINDSESKQIKDDYSDLIKLLSYAYYNNNELDKALSRINWNIKNFPNDDESRQFKVAVLFKDLFESSNFENGKFDEKIIQEIKKESHILTKMDIEYKNIPYLFSSITDFIIGDFKQGIFELELASSIENRDSLFPVSKIFTNILKGNFNNNIEFINSTLNENDIDSQIGKNIFLAIHNILNGDIENSIVNIAYLSDNDFSEDIINDNELKEIIKKRDDVLDMTDINVDSIYISLHNFFSDKPKENINNALLLASIMRKQEDLKIVNKHLKMAIKNNPNYAKYFNFNNLSKDSVIILKRRISNNKDSILNNSYNYKALSFLSNDYKKLGYDFVSKYYKSKALNLSIQSLAYLQIENKQNVDVKKWKLKLKETDSLINNGSKFGLDYYYRATSLFFLNETNLACKDFENALILGITNKKKHYAYLRIGYAYYMKGNYKKSIVYNDSLILLEPKLPNGYYNQTFNYEKLGDFKSALNSINKAIEYYENDTIDFKTDKKKLFMKRKKILKSIKNNT